MGGFSQGYNRLNDRAGIAPSPSRPLSRSTLVRCLCMAAHRFLVACFVRLEAIDCCLHQWPSGLSVIQLTGRLRMLGAAMQLTISMDRWTVFIRVISCFQGAAKCSRQFGPNFLCDVFYFILASAKFLKHEDFCSFSILTLFCHMPFLTSFRPLQALSELTIPASSFSRRYRRVELLSTANESFLHRTAPVVQLLGPVVLYL